MKIYFEDKMQDFLEWELDKKGFVIDCQPFQGWVWNGTQVILETIEIGARPKVILKSDKARKGIRGVKDITEMNYKIIKIEDDALGRVEE